VSALHVFDMDGTLLEGSACLDLSRRAGHLDTVMEVEERWVRGEVGHLEFYELLIPLWEDLTEADVDAVFAASAWLEGIEDVAADIARRGEHSAVISMSPQFFAARLRGFETAHGASVEIGAVPVAGQVLHPETKVEITLELLERYGLGEDDCVAYGDSSSDLPLFDRLENTVAVNASAALRDVAATHYDGHDLRRAYAAGRALLERTACR
jgi:phosphoserine phosphatase